VPGDQKKRHKVNGRSNLGEYEDQEAIKEELGGLVSKGQSASGNKKWRRSN